MKMLWIGLLALSTTAAFAAPANVREVGARTREERSSHEHRKKCCYYYYNNGGIVKIPPPFFPRPNSRIRQ